MEKIQAGFRSSYRILIFLISLVIFLTSAYSIHLFTKDMNKRRRRFSKHGVYWNRYITWVFNIKIVTKGIVDWNQPGLLVGNHLGFIDILADASVRPNLFVTSKEMRATPVLGLITEMGGCIYVERRDRGNIEHELGEMVQALKDGFRVVLYAEATSTNGEQVLPFKRTLMQAAGFAGVPIIPFVFNFTEINGEPGFKRKYRDSVCWYGDMGFATSLWRSLGLKSLTCEIEFLPPYFPQPEQSRAEVADAIHALVSAKFRAVEPA